MIQAVYLIADSADNGHHLHKDEQLHSFQVLQLTATGALFEPQWTLLSHC